ncbi:MAG: fused MFS/spermidine synthase, partial [Elusimicrobiota bacterium]
MIPLSFFLSGGAALVYEVVWVRVVSLFCGHTALAASAVLAAYMAGLALGGGLGGRKADRLAPGRLLALYALLELGIALTGSLSKPALEAVGGAALRLGLSALPPAFQSAACFALSLAVLLIPTTLMGATLPVLTRWKSLTSPGGAESAPDRPVALLYGLNTLGAVLGAAAAGFWLLPELGTTACLLCAAALNAGCAGIALLAWRRRSGRKAPGAA